MNHREDLEFQLQRVTLAIQEVIEDVYITDKERQERIKKLINFCTVHCALKSDPTKHNSSSLHR